MRFGGSRSAKERRRSRRWSPSKAACSSQAIQESDQIFLFLFTKTDSEASIIKIEHVAQRFRRTIMEIRCAAGKSTKAGALKPPDILPLARDQGSSRIGSPLYFVSCLVLQSDDRQITDIERTLRIANANVERCGDGVVPHVWRVMTSSAGAWN